MGDECDGDVLPRDMPNPMGFKLKVDGVVKSLRTSRTKTRDELLITHHWNQVFPKD